MPSSAAPVAIVPVVSLRPDAVPEVLRSIPRWVAWRYVIGKKEVKKVPVSARTGRNAASNRPGTWSTFDEAVARWERGGYAGVGIMLNGDGLLAGLDLDDCLDDSGAPSPEAAAIVKEFAGYTERSPGGRGLRIFGRGLKPEWAKCKVYGIPGIKAAEAYDDGRFLTVTGETLPGAPLELPDITGPLLAFCRRHWPRRSKPAEDSAAPAAPPTQGGAGFDADRVAKAMKARNREKFLRLWNGDTSGYASASEADLALCGMLAFWFDKDPIAIDRNFRCSKLYREKWERADYRDETIAKAVASCRETYSQSGGRHWPAAGAGNPEVVLGPDEHRCIDETVAGLTADPALYQRGRMLVRVMRDAQPDDGIKRDEGSATIAELPGPTLRERITKYVNLVRPDQNGELVPAHPTGWLVQGVASRGWWPALRPLTAVSDVPVLRSDGTIWQTKGYDPLTGVLFDPSGDLIAIPEAPDLDDAWAAVERLYEIVHDFRFQSDPHRSAWLASLLTPLARPAFRGPSPGFLIDANIRGAGKGLLAHTVGYVALGRSMPISAYTSDDDEMRKRITAIAIAGDAVVLLDNIDGRFGNAALDAALTGTRWSDRLLGRNTMVSLPLNAVWYATGNNVQVAADTARRLVYIRLEVMVERPEDRSEFRHPKLLPWVLEQRPSLVAAGLTVLAAYCRAGRPAQGLPALGSFEGWSDLVRNAVVWAGQADPCASRRELAETADTTRESLDALIRALLDYLPAGQGFVVAGLVSKLYPPGGDPPLDDHSVALRAALEGLSTGERQRGPSARLVGNRLRHFRKRVVNGRYLDNDPTEKGSGGAMWRIKTVEGPA